MNAEFDFTLVISGLSADEGNAENKLFDAGCSDATLSFRSGRPFLTFSRESSSLKAAIISAINDVRKAGFDVLRVDICDLVSQADIARRIGRSRQNINQYIIGDRGPGGFPPPACNITDDHPLWYWCEVAHWLYANDMIGEEDLHEAVDVAVINVVLELQYHRQLTPEVLREVMSAVVEDGHLFDAPYCD